MRPFTDLRASRALAVICTLGATGATAGLATFATGADASTPDAAPAYRLLTGGAKLAQLAPAGTAAGSAIFSGAAGLPAAARARRVAADPALVAVHRMIAAGNQIARLPYSWGGGHGSFTASGYDCSGSVSYVLHAAGLLGTPQDSSGLESFGDPGPGRHVTVYANAGHAWMSVDGRRFDTIALQQTGTRWSSQISSSAGYVVRHPHGL